MLGDSSERVSPWSVGGVGNIESENSEAGETGILFEGDGSMGDVILGALIVGNGVPGPGEGEGAGERRKEGGGASSKLMHRESIHHQSLSSKSLCVLIMRRKGTRFFRTGSCPEFNFMVASEYDLSPHV